MTGKFEFLEKLNSGKILVGYDLGDRYSQISYLSHGSDMPETVSVVAGAENYNIPTVLCKRRGVNQWFYGKEALRYAREQDGTLVENLVSLARNGEAVVIEGQEFNPVALLVLFIKRSFSVLSGTSPIEKAEGMMFTCDQLDRRMVDVLSQAVGRLGLKTRNICFQGHLESIYYYVISQPAPLWRHQVLVCESRENSIKVYRMECNDKTSPIVAFINEENYPFQGAGEASGDRELLGILQAVCAERLISSVYLIGEDFSEDWMKESLRFLCKNRRVFQGVNLYSKGACHAMKERQSVSEAGKTHVFLGNEKLKSNVGMRAIKRGQETYFPLLDAGVNWFEAERKLSFILESGNSFSIVLTPLNGKDSRVVEIVLEGLPERPEGTTRIRLSVDMVSESKMQFRIEDEGFGEIFPSSHMKWREVLEV